MSVSCVGWMGLGGHGFPPKGAFGTLSATTLTARMGAVPRERSRASQAMDAYADGDASAFSLVYDDLAPRLYAFVRRRTGVDAVAEDLVQQCFFNVHQARSRFVRGSHIEPWIFAIVRRLTIDWGRVEARNGDPRALDLMTHDGRLPDLEAYDAELVAAFAAELEGVPEKLRKAFLLVRLEGFSTAEAAELLGTTAVAVKIRAYRAGVLMRGGLRKFRGDRGSE